MPAEKTRADSLREYLTGATSDGGTQTDQLLSLGNFRSSTEAESMGIVVNNAISGITINYAGGGNEIGDGTLDMVDINTLQWKCAGGAYGPGVSIANGETKILETDGSPGAFIRVTRTSATDLTGSATVTLSQLINNVFALDDVSSAEAIAGDSEYRATMLVNESTAAIASFKRWVGTLATVQISDSVQLGASGAGTITTTGSFADWAESGWCHIKNGTVTREIVYYSERTTYSLTVPLTGRARLDTNAATGSATDIIDQVPGIALAIDTDGVTSANEAIQTIGSESTAPASVTWNTGITASTGLDIGAMAAGDQVGIWIWREVPEDTIATTSAVVLINDSFDAA